MKRLRHAALVLALMGGIVAATPPAAAAPAASAATLAGTFTNPIKRNGPDPWLRHYNGYYYLATTTWNSTITMRRSRTLAGLSTAADTSRRTWETRGSWTRASCNTMDGCT